MPQEAASAAGSASTGGSSSAAEEKARAQVRASFLEVMGNYGGLTDVFDGGSWCRLMGHESAGKAGGKKLLDALAQSKETVAEIVAVARSVAEADGAEPEHAYRKLRDATTAASWADLQLAMLRDSSELTEQQVIVLLIGVEQTDCRTRAALTVAETSMLFHTFLTTAHKNFNSLFELNRLWPLAKEAEAKAAAADAAAAARAAADEAAAAALPQDAEGDDVCYDSPVVSDAED